VKERWFYEPVKESKAALIVQKGTRNTRGDDEMDDKVGDKEEKRFFDECSKPPTKILL
jgi:hypothetical protein